MSDPTNPAPPTGEDWRAGRWQRRHDRREERWVRGGPWVGGLLLIILGVIFLLRNFGFALPHHWWAIFLLIPAGYAYVGAWTAYRNNGRQMSNGVRGGLIGGTILTLLAVAIFYDVELGKFWPVILILIGVAVITGGNWRR